jgi:hypothetical protein
VSKLLDIFLQPSTVFAAERERPTFLVPLAVLVVLTVTFTLAYYLRVDPEWYTGYAIDQMGREMTATEEAQMRGAMPGARAMGMIGAVGGAVAIAVMLALTALYVWIAAKVTGRTLGFRHGMSLASWSSMPLALGLLVGLVGALTMSPQTPVESLMLTNVDPLLVDLPNDHRWNRIAQSFNLLTFWTLFLFALGWKLWTRSSWLQAAVVALLPTLVVFGVMAAFA